MISNSHPKTHKVLPIMPAVWIARTIILLASVTSLSGASAATRQIATCQEIKLSCVARAERIANLARGLNSAQPNTDASGFSSNKCLDDYNIAISTGVWPGRHGAPGAHCEP